MELVGFQPRGLTISDGKGGFVNIDDGNVTICGKQVVIGLKRTLYASCPLCSGSFKPLKSADCRGHALYDPRLPPTIDWVECESCSHVFTSGYFEGEAEKVLFSKTQACQEPGWDFEKQRELAAEIIDRVIGVTGRGPERQRWLDVGCGSGALLATATEYGFEAMGLDLRQSTS
jgi:hypothetical protein